MQQFGRRKVASALLALVAIRPFVVAMGAFARYIAVGQKLMRLLVVVLFGFFFQQFTVFV